MSPLPSHLAANERDALQTYMARIQRSFPGRVLAVVLFGSKARGDVTRSTPPEESDIDLLVLMDEENEADRSTLWRIASDLSLEHDVVLSVRVYGRERWLESRRIQLPLYRAITSDGISLISNPAASQSLSS